MSIFGWHDDPAPTTADPVPAPTPIAVAFPVPRCIRCFEPVSVTSSVEAIVLCDTGDCLHLRCVPECR